MQCPRKFYEKAISKRIVFQATEATTKGKLAHYAFEKIFTHPPEDRVPSTAVGYVRRYWSQIRSSPEQVGVAGLSTTQIERMLLEAERTVGNWFNEENPRDLQPDACEKSVSARLGRAPMRGRIDRIDRIGVDSVGVSRVSIVDYKTGKFPRDEFRNEALFPLKVYAAAVSVEPTVKAEEVKLLYVKPGETGVIRERIDDRVIAQTRKEFETVWDQIKDSAERGQFLCRTGPLCGWCDAKTFCPAWQ
jgi:putative RecB family exonuclease